MEGAPADPVPALIRAGGPARRAVLDACSAALGRVAMAQTESPAGDGTPPNRRNELGIRLTGHALVGRLGSRSVKVPVPAEIEHSPLEIGCRRDGEPDVVVPRCGHAAQVAAWVAAANRSCSLAEPA